MPEPKIYTKNYVDEECTFTVSSNSSFVERLRDRDKSSQWITDSENNDSTESSVQVDFKVAGVAISRTIDTIILVNHNLKAPTLEYWTGSAWSTLATGSGLTASTTIFTFSSQATTKIRVRNSTTQTTNQEKAIGELIACASYLAPAQEISSYSVMHMEKSYEVRLSDGGIHKTNVKHSLNRSDKYSARVTFEYLTQSELDTLISLKGSGSEFLWQPESSERPDEVYLVIWTGQLRYRYVSSYKGAGFTIELELKET